MLLGKAVPGRREAVRAVIGYSILVLVLGVPQRVRADLVTNLSESVTPDGGHYDYSYTITDTLQSTVSAYIFTLAVDQGANLQSITAPQGWEITYTPGATSIEWDTAFQPIAPGQSASFSFTSIEGPTSNMYQTTGFDTNTFQFYYNNGTTLSPGPAAVPAPEPTVWIHLATALVGLSSWRLACRHSRSNGRAACGAVGRSIRR